MSRLTSFAAVWLSGVLILAYFVLYYQTDYITSKFVADWLALIGLSFMSASTAPVAYRAFCNGIRTDRDKFIFSYWAIWTLVLCQRIWIIILALLKANDAAIHQTWQNSPVSGLIAIGFGLAAVFGGAAPFSGELPIPRRELIIFTIAAGFSGIIAGIAIGVFIVAGWNS